MAHLRRDDKVKLRMNGEFLSIDVESYQGKEYTRMNVLSDDKSQRVYIPDDLKKDFPEIKRYETIEIIVDISATSTRSGSPMLNIKCLEYPKVVKK